MAEVFFVLAAFALPILAGAVARLLGRPWWWGAVVAVVVMLVAAIAPAPEEGESRLAGGDLVFLLIVALLVAGLAWVGARLAGRFVRPA
jgi:4-hydroxybenzoate polyprenyltransferase